MDRDLREPPDNSAPAAKNQRFLWINKSPARLQGNTSLPDRSVIGSHVQQSIQRRKRHQMRIVFAGPATSRRLEPREDGPHQPNNSLSRGETNYSQTEQVSTKILQRQRISGHDSTKFAEGPHATRLFRLPKKVDDLGYLEPFKDNHLSSLGMRNARGSIHFCK